MNFLSPWSLLWLVPIGGVIVALYLLKLRRRDEIVSSVMLWEAVVQDTQANAPFQKLRRNLLLLLQLLVALALVFTVARPFLWASSLGGRTSAIVLDGSASMKATDEPGSRFARAVAEAKTLINRKQPGDQALVVLAGEKPEVLAPLTTDKDKLMRALDKARASDATGDIREAITVAASLVSSRAEAQVSVLSDGAFPKPDEMSLGGVELQFLPVGKRAENVAVTAFDVRDTVGGDARQTFVTVQNFGKKARTFPLNIEVDNKLADAHEITLAPGQSKSEVFDRIGVRAGGVVTARVDLADDLTADNTASVTVPPRRKVKILLVSEGNFFLENALNIDPNVVLDSVRPGGYKPGTGHEMTVLDTNSAPKNLPPGRYLFWGAASGGEVPVTITGADADKPQILDWSRTHPLMRFVDLANVHLRRANAVSPLPWATTLAETDNGPVIVAGERGETRAVYVGFSVFDSDMPLRYAFPIFLSNCVQWLTARPGEGGGVHRPGEIVPLSASTEQGALTVTRPDGRRDVIAPAGDARRAAAPSFYERTDTVGVYKAEGKSWSQSFAVSLLSPMESNIAPVARPAFLIADAGVTKEQSGPRVPVRREIWPWIAAAVLCVLCVEWLVYHRRLG